jgi:hypothetical protein
MSCGGPPARWRPAGRAALRWGRALPPANLAAHLPSLTQALSRA